MFDFQTGNKNLEKFIQTVQDEGMFLLFRPGPYVCGEWDFGGLPPYLLSIPDIKIRCMDTRYTAAVERYVDKIAPIIKKYEITNGGPIIMVQVENEYGSYGNDRIYMKWMHNLWRDKGIEVFSEIPKRYQALKDLTASVEHHPTVMFNTPWNDSWVMPSTQSYMAQLVTDAGADYIYKENTSNSSAPIGLETAYGLIQKADYWINVGTASTLDELKNMNPKFADAKSVRDKTVYNNNLRITATGGNDYWESAVVRPDVVLRDLIHIFHPELVSDSTYYYRHLE